MYLVQIKLQGVPQATSNKTTSMGLHYDLEDKPENFRIIEALKNLFRIIDNFLAEIARFFEYYVRIWR